MELRWDVGYRVERRGRSGNHDRYWIDCPFCRNIIRCYGKDLQPGTSCSRCGAIILGSGRAVRPDDMPDEIRISLNEEQFRDLIRGRIVEQDNPNPHGPPVVKIALQDIGLLKMRSIVNEFIN